jgi:hypothetical protein
MKHTLLLVVLCMFGSLVLAHGEFIKGYLDDVGDADHFTINVSSDELDVTFSYPDGAVFSVLVLGKTGKNLGYFDLTEGEVISLTGGGKFTLVIISHVGDGKWSAWY